MIRSPRLQPPLQARLDDESAERVRRNHHERITELQNVPLMRGRPIENIEIPDGEEVVVQHGMGRAVHVLQCVPRQKASGATNGRLLDTTALHPEVDDKNVIVLKASGFTVTIYVDVWVF